MRAGVRVAAGARPVDRAAGSSGRTTTPPARLRRHFDFFGGVFGSGFFGGSAAPASLRNATHDS